MVLLSTGEEHIIAHFYADAFDTAILSYLQGHMGRGWVDDKQSPRCARIIAGDYCFFGGDSAAPAAARLVESAAREGERGWVIAVPPDRSWTELVKAHYPAHDRRERYATARQYSFDTARLQAIVDKLDPAYALRPIEGDLYRQAQAQDFSRDFCRNFSSEEDYRKRGLGFGIVYGDRLVAGASSFSVYDEGLEVQIATHEDFRRRGLAAVCGAKLILECLARGLYPNWDAAHRGSLALAEQLGYHLSHPYDAYYIQA